MSQPITPAPLAAPLWRFRFGTAEFDEARFELRVAGLTVDVQRKPLEILSLLLTHTGEVVTKEELLETVWEGRPTVENVIANAMTKLRNALGEDNAGHIATQPRVGYRLVGTVERTAVGRSLSSRIELKEDDLVPGRPNFQLQSLLGASKNNEVWIARHVKTKEARVYKFATNVDRLNALKREATLSRLLHEALGERHDFARVFDWNFETPPFFLECEYGGESLTDWATKDDRLRKLPLSERMDLFLQVADAVAAAHGVGVLHKDLKPSNILIAPMGESQWQIRLTDFGSGKLLDPERLTELGITQLGLTVTTMIGDSDATGTLLYLAPELIAQQAPTVKSDIFALGMILYQIVVGDLRKPMVSGWQRQVDNELLREDIAAATDGDPQHRLHSVAELSILLRQLEQRGAQRKQSSAAEQHATALAEAVKRSRMRRPWLIATVATLSLGVLVGTVFDYRLHHSQQALARQDAVVQHLNRFLTKDLIGAANPANTGRSDVTVVEAARTAAKSIDTEFGSSGLEVRAALHQAMQDAFDGLDAYDDAIAEGRKTLLAYQQIAPSDTRRIKIAKLQLARDLARGPAYREADEILTQLEKENRTDSDVDFRVRLHMGRARFYNLTQSWREAIAESEKALQLIAKMPDAEALRDDIESIQSMAYRYTNQPQAAEAVLRNHIARRTSRDGPAGLNVNYSKVSLALTLTVEYRYEEATQLLNEAIGYLNAILKPDHPEILHARSVLTSLQYRQGKFADAAANFKDLFQIASTQGLARRGAAINYELNWGLALRKMGKMEEAAQTFRDTLARARSYLPETAMYVQIIRYSLADSLLDLHRPWEAARLLDGIKVDIVKTSIRLRDWESWLDYQAGRVALQTGRPAEAQNKFEKALQFLAGKEPDPDIDAKDLEPSLRNMIAKTKAAPRSKPVRTNATTGP